MKKLIALFVSIVCLVLALGFTGCKKDDKKIVVGVTDYAPMDYLENGQWVGFDAELAKAVFEANGYTVEFKEIEWETKIVTLKAGEIDCIWNGMTVNNDLKNNLGLSQTYLKNLQVAVVRTADANNYNSTSDLANKTVAVESGSAAQDAVASLSCREVRKDTNQNTAVLEVVSSTADVAIIDYALAKTLTSSTSEFAGQIVMKTIGFEVEEFAIAVRSEDTELLNKINTTLNTLRANGTITTLAQKYDILNLLPENFEE